MGKASSKGCSSNVQARSNDKSCEPIPHPGPLRRDSPSPPPAVGGPDLRVGSAVVYGVGALPHPGPEQGRRRSLSDPAGPGGPRPTLQPLRGVPRLVTDRDSYFFCAFLEVNVLLLLGLG